MHESHFKAVILLNDYRLYKTLLQGYAVFYVVTRLNISKSMVDFTTNIDQYSAWFEYIALLGQGCTNCFSEN